MATSGGGTTEKVEKVEINEGLYSRQLYVLGAQAMAKMAHSSVFLSGLGGLGVEVAKNVALAGVKLLTLNDTKVATHLDLSTQFYLSESDLGKNRAAVSAPRLAELNPYVKVTQTAIDLEQNLDAVKDYKIVILADAPLSTALAVGQYCHAHGIHFIHTETRGVFGLVFVDFGRDFEIVDHDGEEPKSGFLSNIAQGASTLCTGLEGQRHGFEEGDVVEFREIKGMTALNKGQYTVNKVVNGQSFTINADSTGWPAFVVGGGGIVSQVKVPKKVNFLGISEAMQKPEFVITDWLKLDRPGHLLLGFQALHQFAAANGGRMPAPWTRADADAVIQRAKSLNSTAKLVENVDEPLLSQMAFTAQGSLVGLTGFLGGVVAQEVLKGLTGKYTPINQWLLFDATEVLPEADSSPALFAPKNDRYDAQRICIGSERQSKIANLHLFMIGAGAIGCEMLKNYAMLGIASSEHGRVVITDNDLIELSNLNRQFLFRQKDIRHPKSTTAAAAAKAMNPQLRIDAEQDKIAPETEKKYSDKFFRRLDVVVNALDNVQARLYVDSRCVTNQRPLLESGTLGTKGHVQVIVPFESETYGSRRDPPEKDIPFCTLKSFPSQIEHCIEWARDLCFETQFVNKANTAVKFFEEPDLLQKIPSIPLSRLKECRVLAKLVRSQPRSYDDCLRWARFKFETYFVNSVKTLLHNFPLDHKLKDGIPFWASPKRPPSAQIFDPADPVHRGFVVSAAALYAAAWRIPLPKPREQLFQDVETVARVCGAVQIPPWKPKTKKIETDESAKKPAEDKVEEAEGADEEMRKHIAALTKFVSAGNKLALTAADFEKDDDSNFHIDFITAASNLRARVYAIQEAERLKIKRIAGKIIPAIATTTAAVSGLVCLELLKLVAKAPFARYKNAFLNLGIGVFAFSEPGPVEKTKLSDTVSFSLWDRWELQEGDITLDEFCKYFERKYNLKVSGVFQDVSMIYAKFLGPLHAKRLPQKMTKLLQNTEGKKYVDLIVAFTNAKGDDVNGPTVRFCLPSTKVLKGNKEKKEKKHSHSTTSTTATSEEAKK